MSSSDNFLKVGSCDVGGTTRTLTVNTNSDAVKNDQFLSLREALLKTQQEPGCWNIIFKKSGSAQYPLLKDDDKNNLGLGYWTIRLTDSLPTISKSNIRINYDDPKTITLIPKNSNQSKSEIKYQLKDLKHNEGSGSLLNIGEMNIELFEKDNIEVSTINRPEVAINNFNFIKNTAIGGSGSGGGGGGFGAGGGISLFSGSLKVENSVFQGLGAEGGSAGGSCGGSEGRSAAIRYGDLHSATKGGPSRGVGGQFSAGIGRGGSGGGGGAPGVTRENSYRNTIQMLSGKTGGRGGTGQYGSGGGGGGGGGGAGMEYWDMSEWEGMADRAIEHYDRRKNRLIGSNKDRWIGKIHGPLYLYPSTRGNVGRGGPGGSPGLNAGRGANGRPSCGGQQNGSARGAAIAVHDIKTNNNELNAQLFLSNVNLINNNEAGHTTDPADIWLGGNKNKAWLNNVKHAGQLNNNLVDWQAVRTEVISGGIATNFSTNPPQKPFYFGYSSPINPKQAKRSIEWDIINFTKNIHDSAIVRFEQPSSGLKNISGDFSDIKRVTDELWKEQLPDKEDEILKKYNSQILQSGIGAGKSLASGLFNANTLNKLATLGKFNPYMTVGGAIIKAGVGFAYEAYEAKQKRDEALEKNKQNQEKLQQKLQQSIDIEFSPIDVRETRSAVVIDNFTLGEDEVKFQGLPAGNIKAEEGKSTSDGRFTVEIKATPINSNNAPTKIAELRLDPTSVNNLGKNSLENYILKLIHKTENSGEMLLGGYSEAQFSKDKNFDMAGPANTPVIVDRGGSAGYWAEDWRITTSRGNDQIYATDGKEKIFTEDGDDIILPGFGQDTVDAGMGFDWVHYASGPISVKAIEDSAGKISVDAKNRLHYIENAAVTTNQQSNLSIIGSNISQNSLIITINFSENLSSKSPKEGQFSILSDDKHISIKSLSIAGSSLTIELEEAISDEKDFYLSYVKPSNLNDTYSIQNKSGTDIDGFTLTNSINQNEWESMRKLTPTNLSTTIENAEKFSIPSGSIADFSDFKNNFKSNVRDGVTLETSFGSDIIGSNYDDLIIISFQDGDINPNLLDSCLNTTVNGGQGSDELQVRLPEGGYFKNEKDDNTTGNGRLDIYLPNHGTTRIEYEGIEDFTEERPLNSTEKEILSKEKSINEFKISGTSAYSLYFDPEEKQDSLHRVPFTKILDTVSPYVVRLNTPNQQPEYLGSSALTEPLSTKHLNKVYSHRGWRRWVYRDSNNKPILRSYTSRRVQPKKGEPLFKGHGNHHKPHPVLNESEVAGLIRTGVVKNGLFEKRKETVIITINSDDKEQNIDYLDNIMTIKEAFNLLHHFQLRGDDKVEIWDGRNVGRAPTFLTSYINLSSGVKYQTPYEKVVPIQIREKIAQLKSDQDQFVQDQATEVNNLFSAYSASECFANNNQPTTKIAYAGLNQNLSSPDDSENEKLNGRTNEIATMGRITTPPKRLDKKTYLFNDIKVVVGTDDAKNSNAFHVQLDKTQTIKNFNSEVDTIILPDGIDIRDVAITDKTIYFNQKAIASFKGSVQPGYLKNDIIDDSGIADKLYGRESDEKLLFYVYDGDKSRVNLIRQGGDV